MENYNNKGDNNRILIVDDEVDITTIYTLGLQDNGFKVDAFNDPLQALSDLKNGSYNLALLDYKMPNMNGLELYREIRKVNAKVKICFVTAFDIYPGELKKEFHRNSNGKYQDKEEELDLECIIQKPIGIDELVKRVKKQLNS
jgi:two-component system, OmpR family, response regulator ChvI